MCLGGYSLAGLSFSADRCTRGTENLNELGLKQSLQTKAKNDSRRSCAAVVDTLTVKADERVEHVRLSLRENGLERQACPGMKTWNRRARLVLIRAGTITHKALTLDWKVAAETLHFRVGIKRHVRQWQQSPKRIT